MLLKKDEIGIWKQGKKLNKRNWLSLWYHLCPVILNKSCCFLKSGTVWWHSFLKLQGIDFYLVDVNWNVTFFLLRIKTYIQNDWLFMNWILFVLKSWQVLLVLFFYKTTQKMKSQKVKVNLYAYIYKNPGLRWY